MPKPTILFACDLDNTLIYSYKHRTSRDICVEELESRPQSFMPPDAIALLHRLAEHDHVHFVPVTTRSIQQYQRIRLLPSGTPTYAVTTNGGILLENGRINNDWKKTVMAFVEHAMDELNRALALLRSLSCCQRCRMVDGMMVFGISAEPAATLERLQNTLDLSKVSVHGFRQKIYVLPIEITKGHAVTTLCALLHPDLVICAGDSEFDLPMLNLAHIAILPHRELAHKITCTVSEKIIHDGTGTFAQFVLDFVWSMVDNSADFLPHRLP